MTYSPLIPQGGDDPGRLSQGQMLTNFTQLEAVFDVDHVPFTTAVGAGGGKHDQSTYLSAGGAPGTLLGEGCVYVDNSGGTRQYAYYQRESAGISIPFSMIGGFVHITGGAGTVIAGTSFNFNAPVYGGAGLYNLTLTNAMTDTNYIVLVTPQDNDPSRVLSATVNITAVNTFTVKTKVSWINVLVNPTAINILILGEIA